MGQSAALADDAVLRWLPKQHLWIDPTRFNQLSGNNGLKISISPGSFRDAAGRIVTEKLVLELVEIVHQAGMVLAARPTTSRDGVFESAGMFSLEVKRGDESLQLAKPLHIEWPINNLSTRMHQLEMVSLAPASTRACSAAGELDWAPIFNKPLPILKLNGRRWLKFDLVQLGWFSAQQTFTKEGLKSMLSVRYQDLGFEQKQAFLVFCQHQAVVKLFDYDSKFCAFNIPRRAAAAVVMLACKQGQYFLGHTCFDEHSSSSLSLEFQEIDKDLIPQQVLALINV